MVSSPVGLIRSIWSSPFLARLSHIQESAEREEQGLSNARTQFLLRATGAVAQSLPEIDPQCEGSVDQADYPAASRKFSCILDLARGWELDLDEIRRHYVCELYSGGQDLLAQEVKSAVADKALLSSQLLLLVGQRIHKIIFDSSNPSERLGCLTPDVVSFLNKLGDMPLRCSNVPLSSTSILIDQVLAYLPEESREYKLATGIRDSLPNLMQMVPNS